MPSESVSSASDGSRQYFSARPDIASRPGAVRLHLPDVSLDLATDRGVFARNDVDPGTKLLLLHGPDATATDSELVDLGCGYGPIALVLAHRNPQARIWAVDVNERARSLCRANAADNGLENITVVAPDEFPSDLPVERIWSNPPIRIGKAALHDLLTRWIDRLAPGGSAHFVVQKHLGSDSLHRWLEQSGWATTRRRSQSAYRLLDVSARTAGTSDRHGGPGPLPATSE
ncbi:MAG: class I SAM-dependent methyltransferase [Acidimicrobiia bacterium]|nr:class I SAM-dependent methyltransferase [Acidimicrobiia bacterium]